MNAPTGPIRPMRKKTTVDRSQSTLPAIWERGPGNGAALPLALGPLQEARALLERWGASRRTILSVALADSAPDGVFELIGRAATAGTRVYVYGPPTLGNSAAQLACLRRPNVLARRGAMSPPATLVLAGRGEEGVALFGNSRLALSLNRDQAVSAFSCFLDLFWNEGLHEAYLQGDSFPFRPAREAAFDVVSPESGPVCWNPDVESEPFHSLVRFEPQGGPCPAIQNGLKLLYTPVQADGMERLVPLAQRGLDVLALERDFPYMAAGEDGGFILLRAPQGGRPLRILLDRTQADALRQALLRLKEGASWIFRQGARLADIRGEVRRPGRRDPEAIQKNVELDCGRVVAEQLWSMEEAAPSTRPEPPALALSVTYGHEIFPPSAPAGARPAPLALRWKEFDARQVRDLDEAVACLEKEPETPPALLERLKEFLGGQGAARKRLLGELRELRAALPLAGKPVEEAAAVAARVQALLEEVRAWQAERAGRLESERLRMEEQEQRAVHEREAAAATEKLAALEPALEAARDEERKARAELDAAGADAAPGPGERKARAKELRKRLHDLGNAVALKTAEVHRLREARDRRFSFRPPAPEKSRRESLFLSNRAEPLAVPAQALPACGTLLEQGGVLYLVVETWEEASRTREEAAALGARQVVAEGRRA